MQRNVVPQVLEHFIQDVRFGSRIFRKSPAFTAIAVLSLALGIGANTAIFSLVNAFLLRPLPVEQPDRLVSIFTTDAQNPENLLNSALNVRDIQERNTVFSGVASFAEAPMVLATGEGSERVQGLVVSGSYFSVLGVRPAHGRVFSAAEDRTPGANPYVVLSHAFWKRRFGADPGIVGQTVRLNSHQFTVVGIAPARFSGTSLSLVPDLWVPLMMYREAAPAVAARYESRRFLFMEAVGRLKPGVTVAQAQSAVGAITSQLAQAYPDDNEGRAAKLVPLPEARLNPDGDRTMVQMSVVLLVIVGMVLLIACTNVANLLLARATSRRREIAIRLAVGAGRGRLITQLLTESVLLAAAGAALGLALAYAGKGMLWGLMPPQLGTENVSVELNGRVLAYTLVLALASGMLVGLAPALQALNPDLISTLRGTPAAPGRAGRFTLRRSLVVAEVSLCVVALVVASLFVRSLGRAQSTDPGFRTDHMLLAAMDLSVAGYEEERGARLYRQLVEQLRAQPEVRSAVISRNRPFGEGYGRTAFPDGRDVELREKGLMVQTNVVGAGYFGTMGIGLREGRDFTDVDQPASPPVVVLNEALAQRFWPGESAVGRRLKLFGDSAYREVVGVVRDTRFGSLTDGAGDPYLYLPLTQNHTASATIQVRTVGAPEQFTARLRQVVRDQDPALPLFDVRTLEEQTGRSLWAQRATAVLLALFGSLALVLAAGGIFGVVSYFVSQRTRDIGIRLALGAQWADVVYYVMREGLVLVALGIIPGTLAVVALGGVIGSMLFGVSPYDPLTLVAVPLVLMAVAAAAVYLPARRAARVDPLRALRTE